MNKKINSKKIIKKLESKKKDIRKYGVKKIGLFGSFLKKSQHSKSDIDILVDFDKPGFDEYMELKFMLERLFRRKIDLVIVGDLKPELKHIKNEVQYARL